MNELVKERMIRQITLDLVDAAMSARSSGVSIIVGCNVLSVFRGMDIVATVWIDDPARDFDGIVFANEAEIALGVIQSIKERGAVTA